MADKSPLTKSEIVDELAERSDLSKKQVSDVIDNLYVLIEENLGKKGPGQFTFPNLIKLSVEKTKAKPARKGRNPRTGEPIDIPKKPAGKRVKLTALKKLKDMA